MLQCKSSTAEKIFSETLIIHITSLHNYISSAQIDSHNVVADDTTNTAETSTMAAGNIVANYF